MKDFQDEFFDCVSRECGLDRLSPAPKQRVGYAESRRQKEWEAQVARSEAEARERREKQEVGLRKRERDLAAHIEAIILHETEAERGGTQIRLAMKKMMVERARLAAAQAKMEEKKRRLEQEAAELEWTRPEMQVDRTEIERIRSSQEGIHVMWAEAIHEGATTRADAIRALQARN